MRTTSPPSATRIQRCWCCVRACACARVCAWCGSPEGLKASYAHRSSPQACCFSLSLAHVHRGAGWEPAPTTLSTVRWALRACESIRKCKHWQAQLALGLTLCTCRRHASVIGAVAVALDALVDAVGEGHAQALYVLMRIHFVQRLHRSP